MKKSSIKKIITLIIFWLIVLCVFACNSKLPYVEQVSEDMTVKETTEEVKKKPEYNVNDIKKYIENAKTVKEYDINTKIDDIDSVYFGNYMCEDENDMELLEWVVLEKQDDKALLLSKYLIDNVSYNNKDTGCAWFNSSIRTWLNDDFYNKAFSDEEKQYIVKENYLNEKNQKWNADSGVMTKDNVVLMSLDECKKYFYDDDYMIDNKKVATYGTNYAKNVKNKNDTMWCIKNNKEWYNGNSVYLLRTPGITNTETCSVSHYGYLNTYGVMITTKNCGVRPCMWVKYNKE